MPLPFHRRRLDPDAADFCRRSGATDRAAINAYVRGVKDLGLWANMVCWPLRSAQNSGGADPTNTTVYSLGGLGTFNGTRVNGPAWGADGITTTDITTTVTTTFPANLIISKGSLGHVVRANANPTYFNYWFPTAWNFIGFTGSGIDPTLQGGSALLSQTIAAIPSTLGTRDLKLFSWDGSQVVSNRNDTDTSADAQAAAPVASGTHTLCRGDAITSFGIVLTSELSRSQYLSFYTLYKTTLGTGLGLP